ncbi:MAG: hypothetical protein PVJ67_04620 [Candidatus Pacearchaeota archaeon]|jgi:hypothetical protein
MGEISEFLISLKETILNLGVFSIVAIVLIIIILIILMVIEKKLQKKIISRKDKNSIYLAEVSNLKGKTPQETLKKIDFFAREFFKQKFGIKKSLGYSELKNLFTKQQNKKPSDFCNEMNDLLYSGKEPGGSINQKLITLLADIIKENPISAGEISKEPNPIIQKIKNLKKSENPSENI